MLDQCEATDVHPDLHDVLGFRAARAAVTPALLCSAAYAQPEQHRFRALLVAQPGVPRYILMQTLDYVLPPTLTSAYPKL